MRLYDLKSGKKIDKMPDRVSPVERFKATFSKVIAAELSAVFTTIDGVTYVELDDASMTDAQKVALDNEVKNNAAN